MATVGANPNTATPTHVWLPMQTSTGANTNPAAGLPCAIVKRWGMTEAGYDVVVRMDARTLARAIAAAPTMAGPVAWGVERWLEEFTFQQWLVPGGDVEVEANEFEELAPLA